MKWLAKSPDFHGPFLLPGTKLFTDFCGTIVHRYALDSIVVKNKVRASIVVYNLHFRNHRQSVEYSCVDIY
jgi:hypothetical protein